MVAIRRLDLSGSSKPTPGLHHWLIWFFELYQLVCLDYQSSIKSSFVFFVCGFQRNLHEIAKSKILQFIDSQISGLFVSGIIRVLKA